MYCSYELGQHELKVQGKHEKPALLSNGEITSSDTGHDKMLQLEADLTKVCNNVMHVPQLAVVLTYTPHIDGPCSRLGT